jgi:hypothetical protein
VASRLLWRSLGPSAMREITSSTVGLLLCSISGGAGGGFEIGAPDTAVVSSTSWCSSMTSGLGVVDVGDGVEVGAGAGAGAESSSMETKVELDLRCSFTLERSPADVGDAQLGGG